MDKRGENEAIAAMERCIKNLQKWMKEAKLQDGAATNWHRATNSENK